MEEIRGIDIGLPLIAHIGAIRCHSTRYIPWHSHAGFELLFLLKGATAYEVKEAATCELTGGHFVVVPSRVIHRGVHNVRMPSTICGIECATLANGNPRHTPFEKTTLHQIQTTLSHAALSVRMMSRELKTSIARLLDEMGAYSPASPDPIIRASLRNLACAALIEATRLLSTPTTARPDELVAAAKAYLHRRYQEPVRMNDLVKHIGLSRARMFDLFKTVTGTTPNDYLLRYRVEQARTLLSTTQDSITEIAFAVGFSSSQYFSYVFRRYTGETPLGYRRGNT
ncbi:MAG: AraC family transcriptional regulator [Verrucomicrobiota bacterium]